MRILKSVLLMHWARLGSFNALEENRPGGRWQGWLGGALCSADAEGDGAAATSLPDLRQALYRHYALRRRKKTLKPIAPGIWPLVLDGHEGRPSFLRHCPDCLQRTVHTKEGDRTQYYHRLVLALLLHADGVLLLDVEPLRPGEDEIAAARRLTERLLGELPRAFNLVLGDALYLNPGLARLVRAHGKHFLAVLKNENRDLLTDARSLFGEVEPATHEEGKTTSLWWDIEGFRSWTQLGADVRVVRSVETRTVRRQATKKPHTQTVEWIWATSLPTRLAPTAVVVRIGHRRWSIENEAFNELVNEWDADHVCKHNLTAILALWLLLCLAYNLFHVFVGRGLKPALRAHHTLKHWADLLLAGFYDGLPRPQSTRPP